MQWKAFILGAVLSGFIWVPLGLLVGCLARIAGQSSREMDEMSEKWAPPDEATREPR
jgi:hypothetical protein